AFVPREMHAHHGTARFREHADGPMHRCRQLVTLEPSVSATSWIGRDLGDAVVQTRRLEPPRATSPNDVDRRRDRRAVDVRRLRATDDFRRAERPPHSYAQLLYDFVDLGHIKTVPARRPPNERIES